MARPGGTGTAGAGGFPTWPAAFCAVAALLPLAALRFGAPLHWAGTTLLLCLALLLVVWGIERRPLARLAAGSFAAGLAAANALLGVSYYMQGSGLNEVFLYHANPEVLQIVPAYPEVTAVGVIYLLAVTICAVLAAGRTRVRLPRLASVGLLLLALALFTPLAQLAGAFGRLSPRENDPRARELLDRLAEEEAPPAPPPPLPPVDASTAPPAKNLVLIYLEGLERAYLDESRFPGLMPRLRALEQTSITFTNMHGEFLGGTIFGMVASQCGWPLHWELYQRLRGGERFLPGMTCLGDALKERGYTSVYMGGAPLDFGQKGAFLASHGFERVLGRQALVARLPDPEYVHRWGLHDDSLFDLAREEVAHLTAGQPFFLNLLTVGTHFPGYLSASCPDYAASADGVLKAAHCTDFLVARFVETLRHSEISERTVIAVMSDHLMWDGGAREHHLGARLDRRLTFLLDVPGEPARVLASHGTHFDVPATLLSVLDVGFRGTFGLGSSLIEGDGLLWRDSSQRTTDGRPAKSDAERSNAIRAFLSSREIRASVEEQLR